MAKEKASKKETEIRTRNFTAILYPDSKNTPPDWYDILSSIQIPMFISPLHDKDVNPDGEIKKAHYHLIICFDGPKTIAQAKEVFDLVGAVPPPKIGNREMIVVSSLRGAVRYLCHLDNPDKYQYDTGEVRALGGLDFFNVIGLPSDKYRSIAEMITYCKENNVVSFSDLLEFAMIARSDWFFTLCDNGAVIMEKYLKSRSWTFDRQQKDNEFNSKIIEREVQRRVEEIKMQLTEE